MQQPALDCFAWCANIEQIKNEWANFKTENKCINQIYLLKYY